MESVVEATEYQVTKTDVLGVQDEPVRTGSSLGLVERARARVLVIDDEPDIVLAVGKRLTHAGYEVVFAADGAEATKMALRARPDLIILDIGLPCGDGHTVADRIRANCNTMFTPIIYLTARTADDDRNKAYDAGAFAYLTKPFKPEELLQLIDQALSTES